MKTIKKIYPSGKVNMGGIILDQPLPNHEIESIDPILLIHHWSNTFPGGLRQNEMGVGPHPHRGFSPVTLVFKGGLHHRDSLGNDSIVQAGGTQWMYAGKGITHSERPTKTIAENGGDFEVIQFWLNVPASQKMLAAQYIPLTKEDTPTWEDKAGLAQVQVVTGSFDDIKGAVKHLSPTTILRMDFEKNGEITCPIPASYNTLIYILEGNLLVNNDQRAFMKDMVVFNNDGTDIHLSANTKTRAILLSGEPIMEEVVSYGPFVMNSQVEVMEAIRDAQIGKMGVLIEEF